MTGKAADRSRRFAEATTIDADTFTERLIASEITGKTGRHVPGQKIRKPQSHKEPVKDASKHAVAVVWNSLPDSDLLKSCIL